MLIVVRASRPKKLMWPVYTLDTDTEGQTGGGREGGRGHSLSLELYLLPLCLSRLLQVTMDTGTGTVVLVVGIPTFWYRSQTATLRTTSVPSARARSPRLCTSTHRLRSIRSCFGSLCLISRVEPLSRADVERSDAMCPIQYARPNTFTHAFTESGRREIHRRPVGPAAGACH